ncbi:MAG TPA: hypothetical protein VEA19_00015 [Actinomycetota bacterium]|nr:hypothetical protein [Actinomycetota bacterium]
MPELRDLLERRASGYAPPSDSFERVLDLHRRRDRNRRVGTAVVALVVAAVGIGGFLQAFSSGLIRASDPRSAFLGIWETKDADGSSPQMTVRAAEDEGLAIVVRDDLASVCSGAASTMTGTGRLGGAGQLVIASPVLACDDGTEPRALSGPPLEEQLRNLTFVHDPEADALTDNLGQIWQRGDSKEEKEEKDPTLVDFPALTTSFISPTNGFSIQVPGRAVVSPARDLWGIDHVETGELAVFLGSSTAIPEGVSIENWLRGYVSTADCDVPRSQQVKITIDGHAGWTWVCPGTPDTVPGETIDTSDPGEIHATVVAGGRLYLFTLVHGRPDGSAVFDAFVATIDLTPETAVDVRSFTKTFISPRNGYSVRYGLSVQYPAGGKLPVVPATDLWDPGNDLSLDAFDVVGEFRGTSTEIPEGVAIDQLLDDHASLAGCSAPPRSQQADIAIDGRPGKLWACSLPSSSAKTIHATVVASGRLYLFTLMHARLDGRAFFDAIVGTIELRPQKAAP